MDQPRFCDELHHHEWLPSRNCSLRQLLR